MCAYFLKLADITKNNISFSNSELAVFLDKMMTSLETIENLYNKDKDKESSRFFMGHLTSILDEMIEFVQTNADKLPSSQEAVQLISRINDLKICILANGNKDEESK